MQDPTADASSVEQTSSSDIVTSSSDRATSSTRKAAQDPTKKSSTKKRPLKGIWTHADGGSRPAAWRTAGNGKVRGLARKKGVKAFWKTGFDVHEDVLVHPRFQPNFSLPGLNQKKEKKKKKKKKKKRKRKGTMLSNDSSSMEVGTGSKKKKKKKRKRKKKKKSMCIIM